MKDFDDYDAKIQQFFEKRKQFSKKEEKTPQNAI